MTFHRVILHLIWICFAIVLCSCSRVKRQFAVTGPLCFSATGIVLPCISNILQTAPTQTPIGIDPRIVTPGQQTNAVCGAGQFACYQMPQGPQCGVRYVNPVSTADGIATYGAYPWQVFIMNQTGYAGSGVLIDNYNIITAAHKVYLNAATPNSLQIYMGIWDPYVNTTTSRLRIVTSVRVHPNFNPTTLMNDIAIIRISDAVPLAYLLNVGYACLPAAGSSFVGQTCSVSGWGKSAFTSNDAPTVQKQVSVRIVDYPTCRAGLLNVLGANVDSYLDPNGQLCAGGEAFKDACTQDGGAPLVCPTANGFTVVGIVIWGKGCGQPGVYGVYTDITKYLAWIQSTVSSNF